MLAAICLAFAAPLLALLLARRHARRDELRAPVVHAAFSERERHMSWTVPGAKPDDMELPPPKNESSAELSASSEP